ncbi:hypothetical protein PMAYCL1PPCAC_12030, partial [Pristionchus mayeri]
TSHVGRIVETVGGLHGNWLGESELSRGRLCVRHSEERVRRPVVQPARNPTVIQPCPLHGSLWRSD